MQIYQNSPNAEALPAIINHNDRPAVSAYATYDALGLAPQHRAKWYNKNILKNPFAIEHQDWVELPLRGRSRDFALSLDFAKRLAMMARTERGEQIRNYFLQCERKALDAARPRTQIDILLESVQALHAQEQKLSAVETRIELLEAQTKTAPDYFTIIGYASLHRRFVDLKTAAALGSKAKAACRTIGCLVGTVPDPRFGKINVYPREILESVFSEFFDDKR